MTDQPPSCSTRPSTLNSAQPSNTKSLKTSSPPRLPRKTRVPALAPEPALLPVISLILLPLLARALKRFLISRRYQSTSSRKRACMESWSRFSQKATMRGGSNPSTGSWGSRASLLAKADGTKGTSICGTCASYSLQRAVWKRSSRSSGSVGEYCAALRWVTNRGARR